MRPLTKVVRDHRHGIQTVDSWQIYIKCHGFPYREGMKKFSRHVGEWH